MSNIARSAFYPNATDSNTAFVSDLIYERTVGDQASSTVQGTQYRLVSTVAASEGGITYQSWLGWDTDYFTNYYVYIKNGLLAGQTMSNTMDEIVTIKNNYLYVCGYQF